MKIGPDGIPTPYPEMLRTGRDFLESTGVSEAQIVEAIRTKTQQPSTIALHDLSYYWQPEPGRETILFGCRCVIDLTIPKGTAELRDETGRTLVRVVNIGTKEAVQ